MNKPILQDPKCKNCYWGEWRETVQYCSKVQCVKQPKPEKVKT